MKFEWDGKQLVEGEKPRNSFKQFFHDGLPFIFVIGGMFLYWWIGMNGSLMVWHQVREWLPNFQLPYR